MVSSAKQAPQKSQTKDSGPKFINSPAFAGMKYPRSWFVEDILVEGQPAVIGGPKKCLKTTLALDLAISLGTQTPFLGEFNVPKRHRVAVMSGESGDATLQDAARRICQSKGVSLEQDCDVMWAFTLPRFQDSKYRAGLTEMLREHKVKVVIIDPLYLCLLDGAKGASASNLYEIGPLLLRASKACLRAGATPIFVHHATKGGTKRVAGTEEPMDLDDLAFSGIGEFARQWLLLRRAEPYAPGTGEHDLILSAGGSAGHSGCWRLAISEGRHQGAGKWEVAVQSDVLGTAGSGASPKKRTPVASRRSWGKNSNSAPWE